MPPKGPLLAVLSRGVLSVQPPGRGEGRGGGGMRAKEVCVPKMGFFFWALDSKCCLLPEESFFWFWVSLWFGLGVREITPPPPPPPPPR